MRSSVSACRISRVKWSTVVAGQITTSAPEAACHITRVAGAPACGRGGMTATVGSAPAAATAAVSASTTAKSER